jgi:hypothetical protein
LLLLRETDGPEHCHHHANQEQFLHSGFSLCIGAAKTRRWVFRGVFRKSATLFDGSVIVEVFEDSKLY